MSVPLYLTDPDNVGYTYGTAEYDRQKDSWIITAAPAVLEMAKRVFPGCREYKDGTIRFPATTRAAGDLNWLMLRFPLEIKDRERYQEHRAKAIAHALRRDGNMVLQPSAVPPEFLGKLYDFQAEAVSFMVANERDLLADDMGLGKSFSAIAALAAAKAFPALLVVPTNIQRQWRRVAGALLDLPTAGQMRFDEKPEERGERLCQILKGRTPYPLEQKPIYITHYGLIGDWRHVLTDAGLKAVVFDEIQELRHTGTMKYTAASDISSAVRYVFGLSGTPIYNYGGEIWSVTNILNYHCLGDEDSFTKEWGTGYGSAKVAKPTVLHDYLKREGIMLRRRKGEVQSQLPPKRRVVQVVEHDEHKYNALISHAVALAKGYSSIKDWHTQGQTLREIENEGRQATGVAKAPYVAAFVKTLLDAGERVLLYAYHHDVHDALEEALIEYNPVKISGRETQKQKDEAVSAFAEGRTNLVQLSLRSNAGLDKLQGRGTCVVFAELDWSPAIHSQSEDRLHRLGVDETLDSILCYYMVSETGFDEVMQEALGVKVGQFVGIMGDTAETEEDRVLANQAAERHMLKVIEKLKAA